MIGGGLAAVGPAMMGFSALGPAIGALVSPAGLVVAAVAALVAGFVVAYQKSETFREIVGKVVDFLRDTFAPVLISSAIPRSASGSRSSAHGRDEGDARDRDERECGRSSRRSGRT
ncbi:MAG: hypothetical protein M5T61_21385 [Acidimicrobiia bacterium]|nr:hypothetical protein [Acidimicrobiia bacterium]